MASCIDASQGFAGNLTILNSTFTNNGLPTSSLSVVNVPPVAVDCSVGVNPTSCNVTVQDTTFNNNRGQEALGMGLSCNTAITQLCDFTFTRTSFINHQLFGPGINYTFVPDDPNYGPFYNLAFINTTAAALVVKASSVSSFSLSLDTCHFADNSGAGLWVLQSRVDTGHSPGLLGEVSITSSSFTGHTQLPGGIPAATVCGARAVTLTNSLWQGNSMGAVALEMIQDLITVTSVSMLDNVGNNDNQLCNTFDINMLDVYGNPSSVVVTGGFLVWFGLMLLQVSVVMPGRREAKPGSPVRFLTQLIRPKMRPHAPILYKATSLTTSTACPAQHPESMGDPGYNRHMSRRRVFPQLLTATSHKCCEFTMFQTSTFW